MASARKRSFHEADDFGQTEARRSRIRNMWQFANLCQWIYLFGKAIKIDDNLDIEELETECLKPSSTVLADIGLAILKFVSSHRGLTPDLFDDTVRKLYVDKLPERNPFGAVDAPLKFDSFDVFTKIRVLQQLTQWVMIHPEHLRNKMEELKDSDQASWRIEPYGWDSEDRTYFVLDDNRVYRLSDPPPPPRPKKQAKKPSKAYRTGKRSSKRRRISEPADDTDPEDGVGGGGDGDSGGLELEDDSLGGMRWECIAVTLDEVRQFLQTIQKTRDDNEKILRDQLQKHLIPILEKQEDLRQRKQKQRDKEVINALKMQHAKRSSRIANKAELQREEETRREEERKRLAEESVTRQKEREERKREKERDLRLMSREQRLRDREARRIQRREELAQLSEGSGAGRASERHHQAEIEKKKRELEEIEGEEDWYFDCICGAYGQVDDGTHSIACERCNAWQHSKCVGIPEEEADSEDFHFVCDSCRRREQNVQRPKPTIKLNVGRPKSTPAREPPQSMTQSTRMHGPAPGDPELVVETSVAHTPISAAAEAPDHAKSTGEAEPSALRPTTAETKDSAVPLSALAYSGTAAIPTAFNNTTAVPHGQEAAEPPRLSLSDAAIAPQSPSRRPLAPVETQIFHGNGPIPTLSPPTTAQAAAQIPTKSSPSPPPPATNGHYMVQTPAGHQSKTVPSPFTGNGAPDITRSSPLIPSERGISPMKTSPSLPQSHQFGSRSHGVLAVLPPVATLTPTPTQQILTPPVKQSDQGSTGGSIVPVDQS